MPHANTLRNNGRHPSAWLKAELAKPSTVTSDPPPGRGRDGRGLGIRSQVPGWEQSGPGSPCPDRRLGAPPFRRRSWRPRVDVSRRRYLDRRGCRHGRRWAIAGRLIRGPEPCGQRTAYCWHPVQSTADESVRACLRGGSCSSTLSDELAAQRRRLVGAEGTALRR